MSTAKKFDVEARVKGLYYIMQSAEASGYPSPTWAILLASTHCTLETCRLVQNKMGGGEGIEGLYGSLTRTGMHKVLHSLSKSCGLDQTSRLVDIGAGLGR